MRILASLSVLLLSAGFAHAGDGPPRPWNKYSTVERYDALRHYRQHQEKPKSRRQHIEKQYQRWQKLPESERNRIRRNYERYRNLAPEEREVFQKKYQRWKQTPRR